MKSLQLLFNVNACYCFSGFPLYNIYDSVTFVYSHFLKYSVITYCFRKKTPLYYSILPLYSNSHIYTLCSIW